MKRRITLFFLVLVSMIALPAAASAFAPLGNVCQPGTGSAAVCTGQTKTNPLTGSGGVISDVTHIIAIIAGIAAVIIIIVSGIRYMISGGDANTIKNARNAIIYTIVGIVVIVLAQSIISFVVDRI